MEPQQLTFGALEQRVEAIPEHPSYRTAPSRRASWGNGIGMLAGLSGLILSKMLPPSPTLMIAAIALLLIEIAAFVVAWAGELPVFNLRPSRERLEYAETLDHDLPHHLELLDWMRGFPRERLQTMSAFASHRLDRFRSKLPLLTGSMEKLGFLPLATALFLQFKDLRWPVHLSWPEILLIGALMFVYWLSMLQVGVRLRLELYDTLLKSALADR